MQKFSELICKYKKTILIIALLLIIPSIFGIKATKINYDLLVYLPNNLETIKGENILSEKFNIGGYSIIILDNMPPKEIVKLEKQIKQIDNVEMIGSLVDLIGPNIPVDMLPDEIKDSLYKEGSTLIFVTFKDSLSSDKTLQTIKTIKNITDKRCKISGMSALVLDTKNLSDSEMLAYIIIAVILCLLVLELALDSYFAPFLVLLNIGIAILYNMGTNIFLGDTSYITKSIASVLQLGVTMDFSIFLYHSYMQEREKNSNIELAMSTAMNKTLTAVLGSSLTTIAGFLALCSMQLTLGKDIGIVMAKGILFGVICVITILPSSILFCNSLIEKTRHKKILPKFTKLKDGIIKHYKCLVVLFIIIIPIAFYGYRNTKIYYDLARSLPQNLDSIAATNELKDKFNMVSTEMILIDKNLDNTEVNEMLDKIDSLDGIQWSFAISKISSYGIPKEMLPDELINKLVSDRYQLIIVNSSYEMATEELTNQVNKINNIIKEYDKNAILAGEGPLMKDMVEISNHDFKSVNIISIAVIFVIMILILKSISLPVILIGVIETAIFINMGIPYYTKTVLPFIATIVVGTIQLGATIDYAILITTKYLKQRKEGKDKKEAIDSALGSSIGSIIISALCFFGATFGVSISSKIEMISSLCALIARGAVISMVVVILMLPAFLMLFDKVICKTTRGMRNIKN